MLHMRTLQEKAFKVLLTRKKLDLQHPLDHAESKGVPEKHPFLLY